jgi:hypothetical protein
MIKYPTLVCQDCGSTASGGKQFSVSTWSIGRCDICGKETAVTEPRDFYNPEFKTETNSNAKATYIKMGESYVDTQELSSKCYGCGHYSYLVRLIRKFLRKRCSICNETGIYKENHYYRTYKGKDGKLYCIDKDTLE